VMADITFGAKDAIQFHQFHQFHNRSLENFDKLVFYFALEKLGRFEKLCRNLSFF